MPSEPVTYWVSRSVSFCIPVKVRKVVFTNNVIPFVAHFRSLYLVQVQNPSKLSTPSYQGVP